MHIKEHPNTVNQKTDTNNMDKMYNNIINACYSFNSSQIFHDYCPAFYLRVSLSIPSFQFERIFCCKLLPWYPSNLFFIYKISVYIWYSFISHSFVYIIFHSSSLRIKTPRCLNKSICCIFLLLFLRWFLVCHFVSLVVGCFFDVSSLLLTFSFHAFHWYWI